MYSTSLPPSLKSFTLLNAQARFNTLLQNQRASAYSASSIHMQQSLHHGDKLQFSGKRLEELKRKRALEAEAAAQQKILDDNINIKMNGVIWGRLKVKFPESSPGTATPNVKKLEQEACDALRQNPNYPINQLIDDYIQNGDEGRPIKWTLLHKAIFHEMPAMVALILAIIPLTSG